MTKVNAVSARLVNMLQHGQIDRPYLWIDEYNQIVSEIAGTICREINRISHHYVSVEE